MKRKIDKNKIEIITIIILNYRIVINLILELENTCHMTPLQT